ncbi:MAG: hypothetical protein ABN502_08295 [Gammaproteobacteria bacterium]
MLGDQERRPGRLGPDRVPVRKTLPFDQRAQGLFVPPLHLRKLLRGLPGERGIPLQFGRGMARPPCLAGVLVGPAQLQQRRRVGCVGSLAGMRGRESARQQQGHGGRAKGNGAVLHRSRSL